MNPIARQTVVGVSISRTNYRGACAAIREWIAQARLGRHKGRGRYVCVTSVHGITTAVSKPEFRAILNAADLVTPDGMPVVWAMRSFGCFGQTRVYGPTLTLELCAQAAREGHRIFFYGARPETLEALTRNLTAKLPGLQVAGAYAPPFRPLTPEEDADVVARIRASQADIVFVGISTPKQEAWMAAHRDLLPGVVMLGVGAAFDFHAGTLSQAPAWMQRNGLEWLYRLLMEPKRLWRRYLLETPLFLPLWLLQRAGVLRYPEPCEVNRG